MVSSQGRMQSAKERFAEIIAAGGEIPLDETAILIECILRGNNIESVIDDLAQLDELAAQVPSPTVQGVAQFLFAGAWPFRGNRGNYYDASNSLLGQVLKSRVGIPISLSLIMIEVARRVGVPLVGVGMPGHFLVGTLPTNGLVPDLFVDPFHQGTILGEDACRDLFYSVVGRGQEFDRRYLSMTPPMAIIERVLNNLKVIYRQGEDYISLRHVMGMRSYLPGLAKVEADELSRLMAPYN